MAHKESWSKRTLYPHNSSQIHFFCEQLRDWCKIKGPVRIWIMLGTNDLLTETGFTAEDAGNRMKKISSGTGSAAGN